LVISTLALTVLPKSITIGAPSSAIIMFLGSVRRH
jgi:hypothetical protein